MFLQYYEFCNPFINETFINWHNLLCMNYLHRLYTTNLIMNGFTLLRSHENTATQFVAWFHLHKNSSSNEMNEMIVIITKLKVFDLAKKNESDLVTLKIYYLFNHTLTIVLIYGNIRVNSLVYFISSYSRMLQFLE